MYWTLMRNRGKTIERWRHFRFKMTLVAEINQPPLLTNEEAHVTCERCIVESKQVINTISVELINCNCNWNGEITEKTIS
jgi:hypothetical protein